MHGVAARLVAAAVVRAIAADEASALSGRGERRFG